MFLLIASALGTRARTCTRACVHVCVGVCVCVRVCARARACAPSCLLQWWLQRQYFLSLAWNRQQIRKLLALSLGVIDVKPCWGGVAVLVGGCRGYC